MVKHNNPVPGSHFKKNWKERVRCNFNLPQRAKKRKATRLQKAVKIFPRPTSGLLRPIIRIAGIKHNRRQRYGRGFTVEELKVLIVK